MSHGFLKDVRVVEGSAFIAAPMGGMTLAQLGADVIRFDAIGGGVDHRRAPLAPGGRSLYWTSLNKGKRSLAVDFGRPEGRELVRELVTLPGEGGGVLLTNFASSWLGHASLAARRPDLISLTVEGNPDGSSAVDYTVNSAMGFPYITGGGSPANPVNNVLPAWDVACALAAALSLVVALAERCRRGVGAEMRLALSDVALATASSLGYLTEAEVLGVERPSLGNDLYGAFGRDFATRDGRRVMIAAITERQWHGLVAACGMAEAIAAIEKATGLDFRDEAQRFEGRDLIGGLVGRGCEAWPLDDIARAFDAHGVCWGPYQSFLELVRQDPRCSAANPIFQRIETDGVGSHLAAGFPMRLAGALREPVAPARLLGQHTEEILADLLGLPASAIGELHDRRIVASAQGSRP